MAEHDIYLVREKSDGSFAEISGYTHKTTSAQITNAAYDALAATDPGDGSVWQGSYTSNMPMSYSGTGTLTFNTALKVPELLVEGDTTIVHTNTTTSERLSITNDGTGPALFINQIGSQPILDIQDDGYAALFIKDGGDVGIGKNDPGTKLDVNGIVTWTGGNSTNANTAFGWGDHNTAGYATGNQTITLTGDASGAGETSIAVVVADDSHNHTGSSGDFTVGGNLTVNGTTTTINSTTLEVEDLNITVAKGAADAAAADGAGLTVDGGGATLLYRNDAWSFNKNVGIGTDNPGVMLDILGDRNAIIRLGNGRDQESINMLLGGVEFYSKDNSAIAPGVRASMTCHTANSDGSGGYLTFNTSTNVVEGAGSAGDLLPRMTIDKDGNVGIGTTTPGSPLSISKVHTDADAGGAYGGIDNLILLAATEKTGQDLKPGDGVGILFKVPKESETQSIGARIAAVREGGTDTASSAELVFEVSQNDETLDEAMRIDRDGNVGIGNANPGASLDIVNTNNMTLKGNGLSVQGGANSGSEGYSFRALDMNGNTDLFVRGDGNVGIGTTDPKSELHIESNVASHDTTLKIENRHGDTGGTAIEFQGYRDVDNDHWVAKIVADHVNSNAHGATAIGSKLGFYTYDGHPSTYDGNDGLRMIINQDGNVGIGTDGPAAKLQVESPNSTVYSSSHMPTISNVTGSFRNGYSNGIVAGTHTGLQLNVYGNQDGSIDTTPSNVDNQNVLGYVGIVAEEDMTNAGALVFHSSPGMVDGVAAPSRKESMRIDSLGNVGIGTTSPVAALDMGSGASGRSIGWGGSNGSYHYSSIGTTYSSGDLFLSAGFKANSSSDHFLYSHGYDAWDGDATYNPGDYVIKDGVVYEQTHGGSTTGSATDPAGASGLTWWTEEPNPQTITPNMGRDAGIAGMKFDRSEGITYLYNVGKHAHTKNGYLNMNGKVSMALYPDRVEIGGEEVLTTPAKYEYSASDTARQDDTHFYVDTDVSGVTIDGMYEVYATIDNTPEDGQRQIDVLYGKVIIGSGGSGGTKKRYVHYVRENPQPRDLYESNGITLNHDITPYLVFSGTPGSDVGAGDSAQLRLSFNSGAEKHATDIGNINWFKMKLRKTI